MARLFQPVWPLCGLAGGSKRGWEGACAVLNPSSYSMLFGSQVQSGQPRGFNLIPVFSGDDSVTVCMMFSSLIRFQGPGKKYHRTGRTGVRRYDFLGLGLGWRHPGSLELAARS